MAVDLGKRNAARNRAIARLIKEYPDRFKQLLREERERLNQNPDDLPKRQNRVLSPELKEKRRKIVRELRAEKLSYDKIAARLGIGHGTVWRIDHEKD